MTGFQSVQNMPWMQNSMQTFTPNFTSSWDWSGSSSVYGWGNSSSSSSNSFEEYKEKEAEELDKKLKDSLKNKEENEIKNSGLGLTEKQTKDVQSATKTRIEKETGGPSMGEEIGCFTAIGAVGSLSMHPVAKTRTYFKGNHNKLFDNKNPMYSTHAYNDVYIKNAKIMKQAKEALRKAEMFATIGDNKKYQMDKRVYAEMKSEMQTVLKKLAQNPTDEAARAELKDLTSAINKTTSQRVGKWGSYWKQFKNSTIRKWRGKTPLSTTQPNLDSFKAAKDSIQASANAATNATTGATANATAGATANATAGATANATAGATANATAGATANATASAASNATAANSVARTTSTVAGTASKGMKYLKVAGKALKKAPWIVALVEVFTDKDKISAACAKDSSTGAKQIGKTALKAGGAVAGMALGTKLGALIGSVIPGAGTIAGGVIGAVAGFAIGGLCSWLGREGGKLIGDGIFGKDDPGAVAKADNVKKAGTQEQVKTALETVQWAEENKDSLTSAQQDSINALKKNLIAAGVMQSESKAG